MKNNKNKINDPSLEERIACAKKTSIGGQALIEGIMMRGPKMSAMAVRNTQGEIVLEKSEISQGNRPKVFKLPIVRGVFNFVDSMRIGYKALMRSAEISGLDEIEEELAREKAAKKQAKRAKKQGEMIDAAEPATEDLTEKTIEASETVADETAAEIKSDDAESKNGKTDKKDKKEKKESSFLVSAVMVLASVLGVCLSIGKLFCKFGESNLS